MSKLYRGAEFCNPRQTASHQRIGDGFVDGVTNFFNFGLAEMLLDDFGPVELAKGLRDEAQTWERLLVKNMASDRNMPTRLSSFINDLNHLTDQTR